MSATWGQTARLLRRTGFGTTGAAVDAAFRRDRATVVAGLLAADPDVDPGARSTPPPAPPLVLPAGSGASAQQRAARNAQLRAGLTDITLWWIRRMVAVREPFGEKLTFCWHNHFATAGSKVRQASWLAGQNATLRRLGRGDFRVLAMAMLTDAAMLFWLDGERNQVGAANENLAREFMELFTLGHGGGYTETDVREGARALTGWRILPDGTTRLVPRRHDAGSKTVLGVTGDLDAAGFCDAVLAAPAAPRYLATRWWGQLASDDAPPEGLVDRLAAAYGPQRSLAGLLSALLTSDEFAAAAGSAVVDPVDWMIGAIRALRVPMDSDATVKKVAGALRGLGQLPFFPPSVAGWPSGQAWLSTAAGDLRVRAATALARAADLDALRAPGTTGRLEAAAYLLGLDGWSDRTAAVLREHAADPRRLIAVALNSPEYL